MESKALTMTPFPTSQPRLEKNILPDNRRSLLLTNVHLIIREPDIINIYIHQRDVGILQTIVCQIRMQIFMAETVRNRQRQLLLEREASHI